MRGTDRRLADQQETGTTPTEKGGVSGGSRVKTQWWKILIPLSVIPLLLLLAYALRKDPKLIPSPLIGRMAPDFTITLFDGKTLRLSALRGKVVVLNFWSSWCYPACYNEAPLWEQAWQTYQKQGLVLIGIAFQDQEDKAREFVKRFNKTFPIGLDPGSKIAIEYGVYGVPETFFIDREGRIAYKNIGEINAATIRREIEKQL
jgi:cytochrome c biogenesis protein CcmG/thiol:disulfide interchange protein DsbE